MWSEAALYSARLLHAKYNRSLAGCQGFFFWRFLIGAERFFAALRMTSAGLVILSAAKNLSTGC
jgi:hypothetical protein